MLLIDIRLQDDTEAAISVHQSDLAFDGLVSRSRSRHCECARLQFLDVGHQYPACRDAVSAMADCATVVRPVEHARLILLRHSGSRCDGKTAWSHPLPQMLVHRSWVASLDSKNAVQRTASW